MKSETQAASNLKLSFYEWLGYLGIPMIHWGGLKATDDLAKMCRISKSKYVLEIGCHTGHNACYLVKKYGCRVEGIDISKLLIDKARERAKKSKLEDKVAFRVADAQDLPYDDETFDAVIVQFVTVFLNKKKALSEYVRVTKKGGYVGDNEGYWISNESVRQEKFEKLFQEVTGFKAKLLTSEQWKKLFEESGLENIQVKEHKFKYSSIKLSAYTEGGFDMFKATFKMMYYYLANPTFRRMIKRASDLENVARKADLFGYALYVGRKLGRKRTPDS